MNVLVVGAGGREHALCWAISKSPKCGKIYCAPGNAGIAVVADLIDIDVEDVPALVAFARDNRIDLVVVGPEAPLVLGLVNELAAAGIKAFGPTREAAILEGSKAFMKDFFAKYDIPTADYGRFTEHADAVSYVEEKGAPIVVKASGLAAGKGVILCETEDQAIQALDQIMVNRIFGHAGDEVVIEEFLAGEEASFFALVDGKTAMPLASAQDHKAAYDGDAGPNTGGMGAYSPAPVVTDALAQEIMETIIQPTLKGMAAEGRPYTGVLYAGLVITEEGPKTLEFNVRFGDPECQVLMARWDSDVLAALDAAAGGQLADIELSWKEETAMVVVMAAKGYPGPYTDGTEIKRIEEANQVDGVTVLHSGTTADGHRILAAGGRVLGVTALGESISAAQTRAYEAVDMVDWPDGFCRRDIGWRAIDRAD